MEEVEIAKNAYDGVASAGAVGAILSAIIYFMYRHFREEKKEFLTTLVAKDAIIAHKDQQLSDANDEIKEIVRDNIAVQTKLLDTVNAMNYGKSKA